MLPYVLYRHDTGYLKSRKEHRFTVFVDWLLRGISGPKRHKAIGRSHNEELHKLQKYSSPATRHGGAWGKRSY
jgi:hypothetical protein